MATSDCPGHNPVNNDELAMGCWAEHADGSLMFVQSTEGNRVVYSMFDLSKTPPIEYRDAMAEVTFKKTFSWQPANPASEKWKWHDKTPFDWDRVIKAGFQDGQQFPSAEHLMTAAERVAESLRLKGQKVAGDFGHLSAQTRTRVNTIWDKLGRAISELGR